MDNKKLSVIITGTTGMVGEGVLHECLQHPMVERVLIINRKPTGIIDPNLKRSSTWIFLICRQLRRNYRVIILATFALV